MDVSIVIVNYNTFQMTNDCIDSIIKNTKGIEYEIILIDNSSTDDSKSRFEKDSRIKYVYSYENMGFGRANNVGMMLAKGKYIFLLNSDTVLINNAIKIFFDYAEDHNEKAFYGCWLENKEGKRIHSGDTLPTVKTILGELCKSYIPGRAEGDRMITYSDDECYRIGYITGADLFFHRSVYEETKGFDHNYFMYCEESDWQRRASKQGIFSYILRAPRIIHLNGGSQVEKSSVFNNNKFRRKIRSQNYYIRKEYNRFEYFIYRITYISLYIPKLIFGKSSNRQGRLKAILILFAE